MKLIGSVSFQNDGDRGVGGLDVPACLLVRGARGGKGRRTSQTRLQTEPRQAHFSFAPRGYSVAAPASVMLKGRFPRILDGITSISNKNPSTQVFPGEFNAHLHTGDKYDPVEY